MDLFDLLAKEECSTEGYNKDGAIIEDWELNAYILEKSD